MPSGKRINWSLYDELIHQHLPNITIKRWQKQYAPEISTKAIGARAIKLKVRPARYRPSKQHKTKIAKTVSKASNQITSDIRKLRDNLSIKEIATKLDMSNATVCRIIRDNKITLSEKGHERARKASRSASLGKEPWNKGKKLSEATKIKMAEGRQKMSGRLSKLQATFYRILEQNHINFLPEEDPRCRFGHWLFDCRIIHNKHDFLVEVQGDYIHSLPKNKSKDRAKATYMERYFPNMPIKYVWEHEFGAANRVKQKIRQWLDIEEIKQINFSFDHIEVREIDENTTSEFLAAFHYLGKLTGRIKLGAYLGNILIAVSVWSAPTRHETATRLGHTSRTCLELRRFVIHDTYHKKNFGSFILAKMEKQLPSTVRALVSFADQGMGHSGTLYKAANWVYDGATSPSYFYVDEDGYILLKKTLYNLAHKMHMKEYDYAQTYGYEKVHSPAKLRFIKIID